MHEKRVYLDYAATTPTDPRVVEAMLPFFHDNFGNPSSVHRWGQHAERAVENSREIVANAFGSSPDEVIFTSCGSESDNLALRGVALSARRVKGANHILVSPVEHHAVLRTAQDLAQNHGFELEFLPVNEYGQVSPDALIEHLRSDTAVVSIIYANNEIGTINSLAPHAELCREYDVPLHTDAVQAASQLEININHIPADLISVGAHKFYGPKGIGALYVRRGIQLDPIQTGGSQEFSLRAGTLNVPLIVGMAKALEITIHEREIHNEHYQFLQNILLEDIPRLIPDSTITGDPNNRLPNHASFVFRGVDGNQLLAALDIAGFACSSGSACKTGDPEPSDVLVALGYEPDWALGSLRITVGRPTAESDVRDLASTLPELVALNRSAIP
ncbi:MAG: aminotransferase class V-fold PLP-dependent enzyme [Anaerolineales bacterium]|nr:aminotransferase class V-fold PLP-dependent enzyme [Anaerolineales bacterium]